MSEPGKELNTNKDKLDSFSELAWQKNNPLMESFLRFSERTQNPDSPANKEYLSGLSYITKAHKALAGRRNAWEDLNVEILTAGNSEQYATLIKKQEKDFSTVLQNIDQAYSNLEHGNGFSFPPGSLRKHNAIDCHRQNQLDLPQDYYASWLQQEIRGLTLPPADKLAKAAAGGIVQELESRLGASSGQGVEALLQNYFKDKPAEEILAELQKTRAEIKATNKIPDLYDLKNKLIERCTLISPEAAALVKVKGTPSQEFVKKIQIEVDKLPPEVRGLLKEYGSNVVATDKMSTLISLPSFPPRGWPPGTTWENVEGGAFPGGPAIAEMVKLSDKWKKNYRIEGVLRHELGHEIDHLLGRKVFKKIVDFSESAEFKVAYERDVNNMDGADKRINTYLLQKGEAGRQETFAEVFALITGHTSGFNPESLQRSFPEVHKLIENKLSELK